MVEAEGYLLEVALFLAGFTSWTISTMSAGGGSVLIIAILTTLLPGHRIAPIVTIASSLASPARMIVFLRDIDWRLVSWYLPGATAGSVVGGWLFAGASAEFVQLAIGVFLVSTIWQYRMGQRRRSFEMRRPWFIPVSFVSGLTSAVVGASGLLANPFYLNYGLEKERMLATRAVNSTAIQCVKLATYLTFGILTWDTICHGLTVGAGAMLAILMTRPWLRVLEPRRFRQFTVLVMVIAGAMVLWRLRLWVIRLIADM